MSFLQRYMSARILRDNPALMAEYIEDARARDMAAASPGVIGQPAQPQITAPHDYPMMPGEQPISGLMDIEQPATAGTGLFDDTKPVGDRVMEMTARAAGSGVPAFQNMAINRMQQMVDPTGGGAPMNVKEWQYYSQLSPTDQQRYIEMKRANQRIVEIDQVPTRVPQTVVPGGGADLQPLSTLDRVTEAAQQLSAAKQQGASSVLSEWKRIDDLKGSLGGRQSGLRKAQYFYDLLKDGKMASGGMRTVLSYIPFTFTEQGRMDEEFNAFAETAARQALKDAGEVRPTDADVVGMKRAMFGIGRDEQVNMRLLQNFINSIERNNHEGYILGVGQTYIENRMNEHYGLDEDDIRTTMQANTMTRDEVYLKLWKQYTEERYK